MGVQDTHPECHIARKIPPNSALLGDPKKRVFLRKHAPGNRKIYQDEMVGVWRSGQPWPLNLAWVTWRGGVLPRWAFTRPHKFRTGCLLTIIHQTLVGCQIYSYSCNLVVDIKFRISKFPKANCQSHQAEQWAYIVSWLRSLIVHCHLFENSWKFNLLLRLIHRSARWCICCWNMQS